VSSVSEAKLKIKEGEFYYTGTQEGSYKPASSFWDKILNALSEIANYLLGIMTLGLRGVIVGWIEIMEILLTAILGVKTDIGTFFKDALAGMDSYTQNIVNVEKIIFNRVPILHANIFTQEDGEETKIETGDKKDVKEMKKDGKKVVRIIKESIAKWYYVMRLIVIAFMLLLLIFIGIKMAFSTIASEKAVYKQMLLDWVVGMIIVFSIHYIMIFILNINDSIVKSLEPLAREKQNIQEEYQYGSEENKKTSSEIETTLYESARTRAYSLKVTDGFTGMVIYAVLVYYAWKFALIYFRRIINIIILTLLAPAIAASYAFNKVMTGKSKVFSTWLSEYIMNMIVQIVHAVVYVAFVSMALTLSLVSITGTVLAFVLLNFMARADNLIRRIFKLSGGSGSLSGEMADRTGFRQLKEEAQGMKNAMLGGAVTKVAMKATYGAIAKPIGALGLSALSHTVAAVENSKQGQKRRMQTEKQAQEDEEKAAQQYLENDKEAIENIERIESLEAKKQELLKKWHKKLTQEQIDELIAEGITPEDAEYVGALANYGISPEEQRKEQEKTQKEVEKIDKEINKIEEEIQKGFINQQVNNGQSIKGTLKGNLRKALLDLVEQDSKTGKYKSKKVRTLREGGVKGAFWRKAIDSKALRFKNNMKLASLFGLDSAEEKVLKSMMNFWKSRIIAFGSTIAGIPLAVVNPMVGMALLSNSAFTYLNVATRRRRYKTRAARLQKDTTYTFKAFGDGAVRRLSKAETYHVLEFDQLDALRHKKVRKEVANVMKWAKAQEAMEKKLKTKTEVLEKQYADGINDYEQAVKRDLEGKSVEELAFEQKIRERNVVNVGDGVCMQLQNNIALSKVLESIRDIDGRKDLSSQQKIHRIQEEIEKNRNLIITEAITTVCQTKGIIDITNLDLTDSDMHQINYNILDLVEKQGFVKKGEIDLEKAEINEESISSVYLELTTNYEQTNKVLEENIVSSAILEYMQKKGEKNINNLQTEEAKQTIYDMIKDKIMPDSSKESASVIEKLTGRNRVKEEFELSEDIEKSLEENIKKVKKVKKRKFRKNRRKREVS